MSGRLYRLRAPPQVVTIIRTLHPENPGSQAPLGNPVGEAPASRNSSPGTWKRINQQAIWSTEHPLPEFRPSISRHASKPLPCSPGIMPALPNRDGKPLAATVYPAGNGEYCPRFMAVPSARGRTGHLRLRDPRKHLHLVAKSENLSLDIQRFKSFTAREIIAYLESRDSGRLLELLALFKRSHKTESRYQVWEEGSHPQLIESEIMMRQKLDYIHQNPVK